MAYDHRAVESKWQARWREAGVHRTRRAGNELLKYWLEGDINLGQSGLLKQGANVYRVQTDTIK